MIITLLGGCLFQISFFVASHNTPDQGPGCVSRFNGKNAELEKMVLDYRGHQDDDDVDDGGGRSCVLHRAYDGVTAIKSGGLSLFISKYHTMLSMMSNYILRTVLCAYISIRSHPARYANAAKVGRCGLREIQIMKRLLLKVFSLYPFW